MKICSIGQCVVNEKVIFIIEFKYELLAESNNEFIPSKLF